MTTETAIGLRKFCEREPNTRYAINDPWNAGGFTYATDCRVCIRVPTAEPDTPRGERKFVPAADVVNPIDRVSKWHPWPAVERCEACNGDGGKVIPAGPCGECNGRGFEICEECGSDDKIICGRCDGAKTLPERFERCEACVYERIGGFGGRQIARHYASLIGTLPNVCWGGAKDGPEEPLFFRFDGGEGVVMPLRAED